MGKDHEEIDRENGEYDENGEWVSYDTSDNDDTEDEELIFKDANGIRLFGGETVAAVKDLPVKGGQNIKRGDKFKNIRLTDEEGLIESGKMVLKTEFFKKK